MIRCARPPTPCPRTDGVSSPMKHCIDDTPALPTPKTPTHPPPPPHTNAVPPALLRCCPFLAPRSPPTPIISRTARHTASCHHRGISPAAISARPHSHRWCTWHQSKKEQPAAKKPQRADTENCKTAHITTGKCSPPQPYHAVSTHLLPLFSPQRPALLCIASAPRIHLSHMKRGRAEGESH